MSCTCFLTYGKHEFAPDLISKPGETRYRCVHCSAPMEEAIAQENEYSIAWHAGEESAYLQKLARMRDNDLPWGARGRPRWRN